MLEMWTARERSAASMPDLRREAGDGAVRRTTLRASGEESGLLMVAGSSYLHGFRMSAAIK